MSAGRNGKALIVEFLQGLLTLEQAAVDQETPGLASGRDSTRRSRCAPLRKIERSRSCGYLRETCAVDLAAQRGRKDIIERDRIGGVRHAGCRTDGTNAGVGKLGCHLGRKQSVGNNGVDRRRRPRPSSAFAQAIKVPPDETISSTSSTGRPATSAGSAKPISTERSPRRIFCATVCASPSWPARSLTQGRDSASGPTTMVAGSIPVVRSAFAIAGMADRFSASMPGKTALMSVGAMKVSVHRDDAIHNSRDQPADRLLADRFAFVEGCVLAHVAEIGRQQDEPPCARPPQRFRGEQNGNELVIRLVERGIDDRRRRRRGRPSPAFPRRGNGAMRFPATEGQAARPAVLRRRHRMAGSEWRLAHGVLLRRDVGFSIA